MPNHPPGMSGSWTHQLGEPPFSIEKDRYHLYVGLFCPFAHRVLLVRQLKGLQDVLPISVVNPYPKDPNGWQFSASNSNHEGATVDHLYGSKFLREIYFTSDSHYQGRYTVPVLWDKKEERIVNNESEDIMRMLCYCFDDFFDAETRELDFYPEELRGRIDEISKWMGPGLNLGVYKAGFAVTQKEYEENARLVFKTLDRLEAMLEWSDTVFLLGKQMTTADIKLYTTLIRFDVIYQQHFKLMIRSIRDGYPHLHRWLKNLHWNVSGVKETTHFRHIKASYSKSMTGINPTAITPLGPDLEIKAWTDEDERWKKSVL